MPQIKIKQITMMCPTGLGNLDASCRFHRASDNMTHDGKCPTCKLDLVQSTDPLDKMTKTVIGEEDIETEIEEIKERKEKGEQKENDPDISTSTKEDTHRNKRKQDIKDAIKEAKKLEDK